jgi:uncharacterized membrane protein
VEAAGGVAARSRSCPQRAAGRKHRVVARYTAVVVPDPRLRIYLLLVMVVVIWGSYPTLVKIALRDMPPFTLAAFRCVLASTILAALFWRSTPPGEPPITRGDLAGLVVLGVSGITVSTGIFYLAVSLTTAANAVILTASTPVLVAVGGHLFVNERLSARQCRGSPARPSVSCSRSLGVRSVSWRRRRARVTASSWPDRWRGRPTRCTGSAS